MLFFIIVLSLGLLISLILLYMLALAILKYLFKSKGRDIKTTHEGVPAGEMLQESGSPGRLLSRIIANYHKRGFNETFLEVVICGDKRYNLRAMAEDVIRDPDIRWLVLLCSLPQFLLRCKREQGYSHSIRRGEGFVSAMDFPIFNAYVLEQFTVGYLKHSASISTEQSNEALGYIEALTASLIEGARIDERTGAYLFTYGSDPKIENPSFNRIMMAWSRYNDADSTMVILSVLKHLQLLEKKGLIRLSSPLVAKLHHVLSNKSVLQHLSEVFKPVYNYVLPKGRTPSHREYYGYLCYFAEGANDADPVVTINVLNGLIANHTNWALSGNSTAIRQINLALEYLCFLAKKGLIHSIYQHQYYTLPAMAYLWKRFMENYQLLASQDRALYDPNHRVQIVNESIVAYWEKKWEQIEKCCNLFDIALLAHAFPDKKATLLDILLNQIKENRSFIAHELFCAVYPVKIVYGSEQLMLALILGLV